MNLFQLHFGKWKTFDALATQCFTSVWTLDHFTESISGELFNECKSSTNSVAGLFNLCNMRAIFRHSCKLDPQNVIRGVCFSETSFCKQRHEYYLNHLSECLTDIGIKQIF